MKWISIKEGLPKDEDALYIVRARSFNGSVEVFVSRFLITPNMFVIFTNNGYTLSSLHVTHYMKYEEPEE